MTIAGSFVLSAYCLFEYFVNQLVFTFFSFAAFHHHTHTLIESNMLSMKMSRLISVTPNANSSTTSSTSITVSLSVRELS